MYREKAELNTLKVHEIYSGTTIKKQNIIILKHVHAWSNYELLFSLFQSSFFN